MKKLFSILIGFVFLTLSALSLESDFKNSLLKVDFVKTAADSYNIQLYTQKPYSEPIKVIKKTNTNYYLLLPETFHSVSSVTPLGDIKNVEVKLFPYAGQDLNNGYTKINIYTTKPVNIRANLKTASGAVAPSIDTKKLAQLDSAFNSKQAQEQAAKRAQEAAAAKKAKAEAQARAQQAQQAKIAAEQKAHAQEAARQKAIKEQAAREAAIKAQKDAEQRAKIAAEQKAQSERLKREQEARRLEEARIAAAEQAKIAAQKELRVKEEAARQKAIKEQAQRPMPPQPSVQTKPSEPATKTVVIDSETDEIPTDVITQETDNTNIQENVEDEILPDLSERNQALTLLQKIKHKLAPLKPYYYVILDNIILVSAIIVALAGIILLILMSKSGRRKKSLQNARVENVFEDNTEQTDLDAFGEIDTQNNPLAQALNDESRESFGFTEDNSAQGEVAVQTYKETSHFIEEPLDEFYIEPKVLSSVEIAPNRGFMVIEQQGTKALFGYIHEDVFLLYTFREYLSNFDIRFRISEKQEDKTFFIVKIDKFKLLIKVTKTNMKLELEM